MPILTPPGVRRALHCPARLAAIVATLALLGACSHGEPVSVLTGSLVISTAGVPGGTAADFAVTGEGNFAQTVHGADQLDGLPIGDYTVTATPVTVDGAVYAPTPLTVKARVSKSKKTNVRFNYQLASGALTVAVNGLPSSPAGSTVPAATVTGPSGFSKTITATETLNGLAPGDYLITPNRVEIAGHTYAPTAASVQATVKIGLTPTATDVTFALATGAVTVIVSGLPASASSALTITGPGGFSRSDVVPGQAITNLAPGTYTVTAGVITSDGNGYAPTPASQQVAVSASLTPVQATVSYALATGSLVIGFTGLPAGVAPLFTVNGPNGFTRSVSGATTLAGLAPGAYSVQASAITTGGSTYAVNPATQTVQVAAGTSPTRLDVTFAVTTGSIAVVVAGLPTGTNGAVVITGPASFSQSLNSTTTITGLTPGRYTVTASAVTAGTTSYVPTPATTTLDVVASLTAAGVTITYAQGTPPAGLNLTIDGMYLTQAVQTYTGTVPLVAGRDALLRVFVKASTTNTAQPTVRVRLSDATGLLQTYTVPAPSAAVPTAITEGILTSSWNVAIPGSYIKTGLKIVADVDPTNQVTETNEADNSFPASGSPQAIPVNPMPTFAITFVPVTIAGQTPDVSMANAPQYLNTLKKVWPINDVDYAVRAPYTTTSAALLPNDDNDAWEQVLSEVLAVRQAESTTRYYYGVVHANYSAGVAGLGYLPGHAAIGWDYLPSGDQVAAHELGHNMGRPHAPCGGVADADPTYPYSGAATGVYGYDVALQVLKAPTYKDLMSYCSPVWVSDFNYVAVMNYRLAQSNASVSAADRVESAPVPALLVWGRVQHGRLILEPAFKIVARPSPPVRPGPYRLEGLGATGERLFDLSFAGEAVAEHPDDSHFAFTIPLDASTEATLASLRLSGRGQSVTIRSSAPTRRAEALPDAAQPRTELTPTGDVRVQWDPRATPMVMVRDARTGQILSFARGGAATLRARTTDLELVVSDGVRSGSRRVTAEKK